MKTPTKLKATAIAAIAVCAALALAACTPTSKPTPTSSTTSPSASASPTPTAGAYPTQQPVPVPTDSNTAVTQAIKTIDAYNEVLFTLQSNPSLGAGYVQGYVLPGSREAKVVTDTVNNLNEKGWKMTGKPVSFSPNTTMSYGSALKVTGKPDLPYGAAQVFGCGDNSGLKMVSTSSTPAPTIPTVQAPVQFSLVYVEQTHVWMIQSTDDLHGQSGAPKC